MTQLDRLSPEEFIQEIPFLLDCLAVEFDTINLTVDRANIALLCRDLRAGMQTRGAWPSKGGTALPEQIEAIAKEHRQVALTMPRDVAQRFARDIEAGTAQRLARKPARKPSRART